MTVGRLYVQLAAIWHWYVPFCIYIYNLKNCIASVHSFLLQIKKNNNLLSTNLTEWSTIRACPSLMCSFNGQC